MSNNPPSLRRRGLRGGKNPVLIGNTNEVIQLSKLLGIKAVRLSCETFPDSEVKLNLKLSAHSSLHTNYFPLLKKEGTKGWSANIIIFFQFNTLEPFGSQILRLISLLCFLSSPLHTKEGAMGWHSFYSPLLKKEGSKGWSKKNKSCPPISLILSYFPYARALPLDKSQPSNIQPLFRAIKESVAKLFVVELHCEVQILQQYVQPVPVTEISMCPAVAAFIKKQFQQEVVLVSPDAGSARRVSCIAGQLRAKTITMQKQRQSATKVTITGLTQEPSSDLDKPHVIIDDIISTGGTLKQAAAQLRKMGVNKIACVVTHNVAKAETLAQFSQAGIELYTSNSLTGSFPPGKGDKGSLGIDILDAITAALKK